MGQCNIILGSQCFYKCCSPKYIKQNNKQELQVTFQRLFVAMKYHFGQSVFLRGVKLLLSKIPCI